MKLTPLRSLLPVLLALATLACSSRQVQALTDIPAPACTLLQAFDPADASVIESICATAEQIADVVSEVDLERQRTGDASRKVARCDVLPTPHTCATNAETFRAIRSVKAKAKATIPNVKDASP